MVLVGRDSHIITHKKYTCLVMCVSSIYLLRSWNLLAIRFTKIIIIIIRNLCDNMGIRLTTSSSSSSELKLERERERETKRVNQGKQQKEATKEHAKEGEGQFDTGRWRQGQVTMQPEKRWGRSLATISISPSSQTQTQIEDFALNYNKTLKNQTLGK